MRQHLNLLSQQRIGALQFPVADEQAFHSFSQLINLGGLGLGWVQTT